MLNLCWRRGKSYHMSLTMLFNNSFNIAMIRTVSVKDERLSFYKYHVQFLLIREPIFQ